MDETGKSVVKVRIAVTVTADGNWNSCGWRIRGDRTLEETDRDARDMLSLSGEGLDREQLSQTVWVEVDLPVPQVTVVAGYVAGDR